MRCAHEAGRRTVEVRTRHRPTPDAIDRTCRTRAYASPTGLLNRHRVCIDACSRQDGYTQDEAEMALILFLSERRNGIRPTE